MWAKCLRLLYNAMDILIASGATDIFCSNKDKSGSQFSKEI